MATTSAWISAFRLRTLPLAISCILMGAFLAADAKEFSWAVFGLSLLTTLLLQILSNLANDYGDAVSGVDNVDRLGPTRAVHSGAIAKSQMKKAIIIFVALSLISGVGLILIAFGDNWLLALGFLMLGLGSIAAAVNYTVGKNPYGYAGYGDLFVFIFFGIVGVGASYYLHTQTIDYWVLLPAASCGLLSAGVLNVNNIRDIDSDKKAGKKSIPIRIGRKAAEVYHLALLLGAVVSMIIYTAANSTSWYSWLFLAVTPLLIRNIWAVRSHKGSLDPFLKELAITTLLFVILSGIGLVV